MNPLNSQPDLAAAGEQPFPRLAISHLLVLTLTVGFCLACVTPQLQDVLRMPAEMFRGRKWHSIGGTVAEYLSIGIKLFGLIVLTHQWLRGPAWRLAPGHWLLLITGPFALFNMASESATTLLREYWFSSHWKAFDTAHHLIDASVLLASGLIAVRAAIITTDRRWRICLLVLTALLLDLAVWSFWRAIALLGYGAVLSFYGRHVLAAWANLHICLAAVVVLSASIDMATKTRRDWLHYFGLAAVLLDAASIVLSFGLFLEKWWSDLYAHLVS